MKTLIIEDEKPAARQLHKMAQQNGLSVVGIVHSVVEGKKWFKINEQPDLIISDIQLGDGLSFDIYKEFDLKSFILFITAFDQYTLKAFKLNSIDYLLKPVTKEDFRNAIEKFKSYQKPFGFNQFERLFRQKEAYKERFVVTIGQQLKIISIDDIDGFSSENKTTYLHTENRRYWIEESLEELENIVNPTSFFRVNRQFIIKITSIEKITSYTNSRLKLQVKSIEEEMVVSRERVKNFKNWIGK
ncbi:MAG: LytR/AlgR family response regulator transcription factor [Flavobacteriales bacterium]